MIFRNKFITVAAILFITNGVAARPWYVEPQLNVSAGYDDNPGLEIVSISDSDTSLVSDGGPVAFVGGGVRLGSETETDLIAFDFEVLARRYNNAPELDSEYLLASALYRKTGLRHDFGVEMGATKDSTLETELIDTGRFDQNVDRQELFFRPTLTLRFSPLWEGEFELGYRDVSYNERINDDGSSLFVDYEDIEGLAQIDRIISERMRVFGFFEFVLYRPKEAVGPIGIERDEFRGVQLGLEYDISESLMFSVSAGRGYTETDLAEEQDRLKYDSPIYSAALIYEGTRNSVSADYERTFESSGAGSLTLNQIFSFSLRRPETFGGTLSFPISYIKRDPERADAASVVAETRNYFELAPSIVWDISRNLSTSVEIRYRDQELGSTDSDVIRNVTSTAAMFGLRYDFGRKRISY